MWLTHWDFQLTTIFLLMRCLRGSVTEKYNRLPHLGWTYYLIRPQSKLTNWLMVEQLADLARSRTYFDWLTAYWLIQEPRLSPKSLYSTWSLSTTYLISQPIILLYSLVSFFCSTLCQLSKVDSDNHIGFDFLAKFVRLPKPLHQTWPIQGTWISEIALEYQNL